MDAPTEIVLANPEDHEHLEQLREKKPARRHRHPARPTGARVADALAATIGSWRFIIIQSALLLAWMVLNVIGFLQHWDPYPFILLNLALSFQAAYSGPIIMMSQNRQAEIDRKNAEHDYEVNVKAELEIELLHNKIDALREQEIVRLTKIIEELAAQLKAREEDQPA
jgi:uncharacterized membrane protein